MPIIRIKDAIMGTGKSTDVINSLNRKVKEGKQYKEPTLMVLPYLKEIIRFKDACPGMKFEQTMTKSEWAKLEKPTRKCDSKSKTEDLKLLLLDGANILCTHALFDRWDTEIAELIERGGYHVIIDEEVSCLSPLKITSTTIKELTRLELISIDPETKRVNWSFDKSDDENGEYQGAREHQKVRQHCQSGSIYMYGDEGCNKPFIVWEVPFKFFQIARSYTILTYRFESSELAAFFKTHDIGYKIEHIQPERQAELKEGAKELVTIIDPPSKVKDLTKGRNSLSMTWFNKCSNKDMKSIRESLGNSLRRAHKVNSENMIWTCPKEYSTAKGRAKNSYLAIPGYKSRHLAWTCKGTNDYRHCDTVVYLMNVYPNVNVQKYLNDKGGDWNQDEYALSCMLQFIWRSSIRDGKPIELMIVNPRMRELFVNWLHA